jgi:3-oxoadipate enol-lactonase
MPIQRVEPDLDMHYVVDDFTDPWRKSDTILMIHGNNESGAAWYGWVPQLARPLQDRAPGHARLWPVDADAA